MIYPKLKAMEQSFCHEKRIEDLKFQFSASVLIISEQESKIEVKQHEKVNDCDNKRERKYEQIDFLSEENAAYSYDLNNKMTAAEAEENPKEN